MPPAQATELRSRDLEVRRRIGDDSPRYDRTVAVRPPLIPPADSRRIARQLRASGRIVLIVSLFVAGLIAWREWRRAEPAPDELIAGYDAAERRQVGEMYGLFARDVWDTWSEVRRPYPAAAIIATTGAMVFWGFNRLARRHETESS